MDDDGQFDYRTLTRAEIEYAIQHIDGSKFPKNLANARAAFDARISGESPEPAPTLDKATDARYTYWVEKFLGISIAAYAALGLSLDNVMIPTWSIRRGVGGIQLHGNAAWIGALAMILVASIPFFGGLDDSRELIVRPRFRYIFIVAIILALVAVIVGQLKPIA